jgi:hypothetical protein
MAECACIVGNAEVSRRYFRIAGNTFRTPPISALAISERVRALWFLLACE